MEILMIPMAKTEGAELAGRPRGGRGGEDSSFSGHLDRKLAERRRDDNNVMGSRQAEARPRPDREAKVDAGRENRRESRAAAADNSRAATEVRERRGRRAEEAVVEPLAPVVEPASVADLTALLGEYLDLLRQEAGDVHNGPGAFTFTITDVEQLTALAASAGMSEADTALLLEKFAGNQGQFEMADFLGHFSRHFLSLEENRPIPVPETDLPYLQLLLSKLGVEPEEVARIGEQAVLGDNTLDLAAFLRGLQELNLNDPALADKKISLSGWDAEQLQAVLDAAGVSRALQRELLPELHAPWDQPQRPNLPLELDADRFREILARGLAEVEAGRPRPEMAGFLAQLKEIFSQAGFTEQRVGWSPVVQAAVEKIYGKLLEGVDLATVRIERAVRVGAGDGEKSAAAPSSEVDGEMLAGSDAKPEAESLDYLLAEEPEVEENFAALAKDAAAGAKTLAAAGSETVVGLELDNGEEENFSGRHFMNELRVEGRSAERGGDLAAVSGEANADQQRVDTARNLPPGPRFNSQLEQQIFNRISAGVAGGLNRNEHHLVMHLYPRELGEVRVEMMVRDNHVSLNFAMESTRVKEVLEKNMEMFKESLERRGFSIGECMVSVDQNSRDDSGEAWQRFAANWSQQQGQMVRRESLAEVAENVLYLRPVSAGREQGVDLFA